MAGKRQASDLVGQIRQDERELERRRRRSQLGADEVALWASRLRACLFPQQLAFVDDPARQKAALCARRSGKTYAVAVYLLLEALLHPRTVSVYVARTRQRAQDILWTEPSSGLKALVQKFGIRCKADNDQLSLTFPNGSVVRLYGCEDWEQANKLRGGKYRLAIIDEAADLPSDVLGALVDDVLPAALSDLDGAVCMVGTPGVVPWGPFYFATEGVADEDGVVQDWSVHRWNQEDNVSFPRAVELVRLGEFPDARSANRHLIERGRLRKGWPADFPKFVRESLGRWVRDSRETLYAYDVTLHSYEGPLPAGHEWSHVVGGDFGFRNDPSAVVVWAFSPSCDTVYEAYSWKDHTRSTNEAKRAIVDAIRQWRPVGVALETAGAGDPIIVDLRQDGYDVDRADKNYGREGKAGDIEYLSGRCASGHVRLRRGGLLEAEWVRLKKDRRTGKEVLGQEDHCSDAALYGFKKLLRYWRFSEPVPPPTPEQRLLADLDAGRQREYALADRQREAWWERAEDAGSDWLRD